jgi:hypothetical protein
MSTLLGPRARTPASLGFSQILGRLVLAGLFGGLLAGAWLLLVTEPAIRSALAVEEARRTAGGAAPHGEMFSRTTQLVGGVLGIVITGLVLAFVFATVYARVRHRLPGGSDLARTSLLAAIAFGIVGLLPAVAVPANPPGVGELSTVGGRTAVYGAVLLGGVVIAMLVGALVSLFRDLGFGVAATGLVAAVLAVVLVGLVVLLVPESADTVPADISTGLLWRFRLASLGQLLVLWGGIGVAGGWLLDRAARRAV